jgi:hypothetical protein
MRAGAACIHSWDWKDEYFIQCHADTRYRGKKLNKQVDVDSSVQVFKQIHVWVMHAGKQAWMGSSNVKGIVQI